MATGTIRADSQRPSLADLPYEIQVLIFRAASEPQVLFMEIAEKMLKLFRPTDKGVGLACRLSRQIYTQSRTLCRRGNTLHWVDLEQDILYLYRDDQSLEQDLYLQLHYGSQGPCSGIQLAEATTAPTERTNPTTRPCRISLSISSTWASTTASTLLSSAL